MAVAVFNSQGDYPLEWYIECDKKIITPSPGYDIHFYRGEFNTTEDGTGNQGSIEGRWVFKLKLNRKIFTEEIDWLYQRMINRQAFYFYLPWVTSPPDTTGVTVAGRVLVRVHSKSFGGTLVYGNRHEIEIILKQQFNVTVADI